MEDDLPLCVSILERKSFVESVPPESVVVSADDDASPHEKPEGLREPYENRVSAFP